jgi:hypothetical protein
MATVPQPVPQGPPASIPIQLPALTFDYGNMLNDQGGVVRPLTCTDIFDEDLCKTLAELEENAKGLTKEIDEYVKANDKEVERLKKLVEASTSAEVTQQLNATIAQLQAQNSRLKGVVASTNTYVGGIRDELSKKRKLGSVAIEQSGADQGGVQGEQGGMEDVIEEEDYNALRDKIDTEIRSFTATWPEVTQNDKARFIRAAGDLQDYLSNFVRPRAMSDADFQYLVQYLEEQLSKVKTDRGIPVRR